MIKFKKYFNLKIITMFTACAFILNSTAYGINQPVKSHLRVPMMGAGLIDMRHRFEDRAKIFGGKVAWDEILEELAPLIGFRIASPSVRLPIENVWGKFIRANEKTIDYGNSLIEADLGHGSESAISKETVSRPRKIIRTKLVFPEELEKSILSMIGGVSGKVIARSSARHEDSYTANLAGVFKSAVRSDQRLTVQAIKDIFRDTVYKIWLGEHVDRLKAAGYSHALNAEDGLGILIQGFIDFDAAGIAMSNLYGQTIIEAVVGDAETAVMPVYANMSQFKFLKDGSGLFEYAASYSDIPYEVKLHGRRYCRTTDKDEMLKLMQKYPKIKGKFSPISEEQAKELNRVVNALEEKVGVPLDVEWGYKDGKLYIVQIRPIIGDFKKPIVEMNERLKQQAFIASTPIAIGHTKPEGVTGRVVLFGHGVSKETVDKFEANYNGDYIRVQPNVAYEASGSSTKAKVLVDPDQGSREAHSINLITDKIAEGEFVYVNGPTLKKGFDQNLHFIPHPTLRGVWVSQEYVTCFSDGLKANFYVDSKSEIDMKTLYRRQQMLMEFHAEMLKELYNPKPCPDLILDKIDMKNMRSQSGVKFFDIGVLFEPNPVSKFADNIRKGLYDKGDIDFLKPELDFIEDALSYPLYGLRWESTCIDMLRRIFDLRDAILKFEEERKKIVKKKKPLTLESPKKLRVLFVDDWGSSIFLANILFTEMLGEEEYEFRFASDGKIAANILETEDIDLVIYDVDLPGFNRKLKEEILKIQFRVMVTAFREDQLKGTTAYGELFERSVYFEKKGSFIEEIIPSIRQLREQQLRLYEEAMLKLLPEKPEKLSVDKEKQKAVFVVTGSSREGDDFTEAISGFYSENIKVISINSLFLLERALDDYVPLLVIMDTEFTSEDVVSKVMQPIKALNQDVSFIVTSDRAAVLSTDDFQGFNILQIIEKPFHFQRVLESIKAQFGLLNQNGIHARIAI